MHRKEPAQQRVSVTRLVSAVFVAAFAIVVVACASLVARWATDDSLSVAEASPSPSVSVPTQPQEALPVAAPRTPFPSDDSGFIDSSARCGGSQPAYAIGRTQGSLVVICGERAGQYEYLGVRLSDAAVLRTDAQTDSTRTFVAQKAGVLYAVSPTELKVTAGDTVIKQEPMIEYREVIR